MSHFEKSGIKTLREAIGHLPPIKAGETHKDDYLHKSSKLSELNLKRIRATKQGESWVDWPKDLKGRCHNDDNTFIHSWGRLEWDGPCGTITTQFNGYGNGRYGHPEQDRGLSLREGAILQGFPNDFCFLPPIIKNSVPLDPNLLNIKETAKLIGNAVPPPISYQLALIIKQQIRKHIGLE